MLNEYQHLQQHTNRISVVSLAMSQQLILHILYYYRLNQFLLTFLKCQQSCYILNGYIAWSTNFKLNRPALFGYAPIVTKQWSIGERLF